ncbi:hypothetical protein GF324_07545 [bacterium]|nr:hypothetical protein [bacterium]
MDLFQRTARRSLMVLMVWLIPALAARAQVWSEDAAAVPSMYGLEMNLDINRTDYALDDVYDHLNARVELSSLPETSLEIDEANWVKQYDGGLTFRAWRLLATVQYSYLSTETAKYRTRLDFQLGEQYEQFDLHTRELLFGLGYLQPVMHWLDVAVLGMGGPAWALADAQKKDLMSPTILQHDLEGNYTAWRVEGRLRFNLRDNLAVHLKGGYRWSDAGVLTGSFYERGEPPYSSDTPYTNYANNDALKFDYSGVFVGVGVTLMSPMFED